MENHKEENEEQDIITNPPVDKCDKNNPNDPHYGEAGEYNSSCVWIADIGK
jgi:hypothetical protein